MNVKELAEVAGVSVDTIRRTAKKLFPDAIKRGVKTKFTKDQCFDIMQNVKKKNMVSLEQQNAVVEQQNAVVDYKAIGEMIGAAVSAAMKPIVDELKEIKSTKLLPEPIKEDHYTLAAYCSINGITVNRSELATHGMALKKIANREGVELKKIPDERWGFVNSYPVNILDEYFAA